MLTTGLKMKIIDKKNTLPSMYNKKRATNLDTMKIDDNDIWEIIVEIHRRDKFDNFLILI